MIVEEKDREGKNQIVEEGVVSGEDDADLPGCDDEETDYADATREEKHPDQDKLKSERGKCGGGVESVREMLHVPANPSGQRTVLVILIHGGEMAPLRIAAGNFGDAGFEVDAKPFPEEKKNTGANGRAACAETRAKSWGRREERKKAGLEKHAVGLVAGEI